LQTLGPTYDLEFNGLALVERAVAIGLNRGEMDENVLSGLALDESEALARVKPLYSSLFLTQCSFSFQISYLMLLSPGPLRIPGVFRCFLTAVKRAENKKGRKLKLATPLKQKAKQEQQTQVQNTTSGEEVQEEYWRMVKGGVEGYRRSEISDQEASP